MNDRLVDVLDSDTEIRVPVDEDADVVIARQKGRALSEQLGLSTNAQTMVATAISEVARNIVTYAGQGQIVLTSITDGTRHGIQVVAIDDGPGIADIYLAMRDGYSTINSLGMGLPGARRLMDDFSIASEPDGGTTVTMRKWVPATP